MYQLSTGRSLTISGCHGSENGREVLLASSGQKLGMLLKTPHCRGQLPGQRNRPVPCLGGPVSDTFDNFFQIKDGCILICEKELYGFVCLLPVPLNLQLSCFIFAFNLLFLIFFSFADSDVGIFFKSHISSFFFGFKKPKKGLLLALCSWVCLGDLMGYRAPNLVCPYPNNIPYPLQYCSSYCLIV